MDRLWTCAFREWNLREGDDEVMKNNWIKTRNVSYFTVDHFLFRDCYPIDLRRTSSVRIRPNPSRAFSWSTFEPFTCLSISHLIDIQDELTMGKGEFSYAPLVLD